MQKHEFYVWLKDTQRRPCFGTIDKVAKTRDVLSDGELQKRVIALLDVLKKAEIPLDGDIGAMAYSSIKWQQTTGFHIKYFMKPEEYLGKFWPRYISTMEDPPNKPPIEKLKENFAVDYYGGKLRDLYAGLIKTGEVNELGQHLICAKTDESLMAIGPVVLFNKEPVTCIKLTNEDLFTFEQAIRSKFGKDTGFSVWMYVTEENKEEVQASKIRVGAKIDETKFIKVTNPSMEAKFLEKYTYKKKKDHDYDRSKKRPLDPFTRSGKK